MFVDEGPCIQSQLERGWAQRLFQESLDSYDCGAHALQHDVKILRGIVPSADWGLAFAMSSDALLLHIPLVHLQTLQKKRKNRTLIL